LRDGRFWPILSRVRGENGCAASSGGAASMDCRSPEDLAARVGIDVAHGVAEEVRRGEGLKARSAG
jgi:hypothetical protein